MLKKAMINRIDWLRLVMRRREPMNCVMQLSSFIAFEAYYQVCKLRGYPAKHFLAPRPEAVSGMLPGERVLYIWPRLPLSIRFLDRIVPFGRSAHAETVPYTPEAAAAARAAGRRVEVIEITSGELTGVSS